MADNTIFDSVFKTMVEKMPGLVIPLINEVFGTNYPKDVRIERLDKEQHNDEKNRITDSKLRIGDKIYHIECQSTEDNRMVVRMIEYDFRIGLENVEKEEGRYRMRFPHSCILNLRGSGNADQKAEELEIILPDGRSFLYKVPVLWMADYTRDAIFQKHLLFLLPFYIIKYEKSKKRLAEDDQYLQQMLEEYREIQESLVREQQEGSLLETASSCRDLISMIKRIADYIFRDTEKARKGVEKAMGGYLLELESEREAREKRECMEKSRMEGLEQGIEKGREEGRMEGREEGRMEGREEGRMKGREEGRMEGREEGRMEGRQEGRQLELQKLIQKKLQKNKSISVIADELEMEEAAVLELMGNLQKNHTADK